MKLKTRIFTIIVLLTIGYFSLSSYFHGPGDEASISEISGNAVNYAGDKIVPVDQSNSFFEFEGYAVGKSHIGTFDDWSGNLIYYNGEIIGADGMINVVSVNTGIDKLDNHLKNDDFFDVEKYPEIKFVSTGLEDGIMTGELDFRGVKKEISFPIVIDNGISADFFLDVTSFEFKNTGVNKDVRISFRFEATEGI